MRYLWLESGYSGCLNATAEGPWNGIGLKVLGKHRYWQVTSACNWRSYSRQRRDWKDQAESRVPPPLEQPGPFHSQPHLGKFVTSIHHITTFQQCCPDSPRQRSENSRMALATMGHQNPLFQPCGSRHHPQQDRGLDVSAHDASHFSATLSLPLATEPRVRMSSSPTPQQCLPYRARPA
jgi:hypothetical protein